MMNYKIYIVLLLTFVLYACNSKTSEKENKSKEAIALKPFKPLSETEGEVQFADTISINYVENKAILNILKLLPEETFRSWEWNKKDREKTVDFIAENNFLIDTTEGYNNIEYIKPNTLGIQVVDGFWTLSIYDYGEDEYFIVTNDIVGDGNDIETLIFSNNEIKPLKMINWFGEFQYEFLLDTESTPCLAYLEENDLTYNYDFSDKDIVTISSWLIKKEEAENCLKGNSIKYKLNKENRTFDIVDIYWEDN